MKWLKNLFKRKPVKPDYITEMVIGDNRYITAGFKADRCLTDEQVQEVNDYLCDKYQIERK